MLYLYVKGNAEQALQAVNDHGIHPSDRPVGPYTYVPAGMSAGYVVSEFFVKDECRPGVDRWYAETIGLTMTDIPFPPGTLLSYDRDHY